jgi:uncharacterized membrane protein
VVIVALLAAVFTAGTFLAPVMVARGNSWGGLLHLSYAPVCHQQAARSLPVGEAFQSVCARCSGLYLGGVAGLFAGAFLLVGRRGAPKPLWLVLIALPTLVDALLPWLGLPGMSNLPRLLLAWPVGFAAALFVARGIEEIVHPRTADRGCGAAAAEHTEKTASRTGRASLEVVDG